MTELQKGPMENKELQKYIKRKYILNHHWTFEKKKKKLSLTAFIFFLIYELSISELKNSPKEEYMD